MKYEIDNMPFFPPPDDDYLVRKPRRAPLYDLDLLDRLDRDAENESPRTGRTVQRQVSGIDQA